jgi:hypothetical protein
MRKLGPGTSQVVRVRLAEGENFSLRRMSAEKRLSVSAIVRRGLRQELAAHYEPMLPRLK